MSISLAHIWRHPIKAHGREKLTSVELTAGQAMPFDRRWAITNQRSKYDADAPSWVSCGNFIRGAKISATTAIECSYDEEASSITLTHPRMETLSANPKLDNGARAIVEFSKNICAGSDWIPTELVELEGHGFTDTEFPSISILNLASLRDLSKRAGHEFVMERFRGNLWLDGVEAWEELEWVGKRFQIGDAILEIKEVTGRCSMTSNDPSTGEKDFDTLKLLREEFGHTNFGIYAEVIHSGRIHIGATCEVMA